MSRKYGMKPNRGTTLAVAAGVLMAASVVRADIVACHWVDDAHFNYKVTHMPDLDQRRDLLDCDGSIHCVPTSATNLMMFIANHGFPAVAPGPGYWEGDSRYDDATQAIDDLGELMGTSCANDGTGGTGAHNGTIAWLEDHPEFVVSDHVSIEDFAPTHAGIGKSLCGGRIGRISYGRYDVVGDFKGIPLVDRDGGHSVTVVKVRRNGAARELWVHDPASDDGDLDHQSPFFNDIWTVTDLTVIVMPDIEMKTMTAVNYTPGDAVIRLIDGHGSIRPIEGYCFSSSLTGVQAMNPLNLYSPGAPPTTTFPSPTLSPILGFDWFERQEEFLVIATSSSSPPSLVAIDRLTGQSHPVPTPTPPSLVCVGRSDQVYVSPGDSITRLLYPASGAGPALPLPHTAHAMIYDDANDQVVLLSRTARRLMRCKRDLSQPPATFTIPTSVPMGPLVQIAINPADGSVWFWTNTSTQLWKFTPSGPDTLAAQAFSLPTIANPQAIAFDDRGHMYVPDGGTVKELELLSVGWVVVPAGLFNGMPAFRGLQIARSRANIEPGVHDTPGWTKNIDPADLPSSPQAGECPADIAPILDADGVVDIDDLFLVINQWGPCASQIVCLGDIDESGIVDVDDLFAVINGWGPCD